jgi:hypothetical protein
MVCKATQYVMQCEQLRETLQAAIWNMITLDCNVKSGVKIEHTAPHTKPQLATQLDSPYIL